MQNYRIQERHRSCALNSRARETMVPIEFHGYVEDGSDFEPRPSHVLNNSRSATCSGVSKTTNLYPLRNTTIPTNTFDRTSHLVDLNELSGIKHPDAPHQDDVYIDELRREALARQRPAGYAPERPPYDRHRPAKEELELMGVEILEDFDDDEEM
jgi:hypothetical protein